MFITSTQETQTFLPYQLELHMPSSY